MKMPGKIPMLALALGVAGMLSAGPGADGAQRFKDDLRFLNSKLIGAKHRLRRAADGEDTLAGLLRQADELRSLISQLEDLGGRIDSTVSRLRYLKNYEVEPKLREVERVQKWAESRAQDYADRLSQIQRQGSTAAAKPHNGQTEAECSTCREVAAISRRFEAVKAEAQNFMTEAQRDIERAVAAAGKAQQEMSEAGARHGRLAEEFAGVAREYGAARDPLAQQLEQIENEPPPTTTTGPFGSPSVTPGQAQLVARPPPIGAGVSPRALDQLRVVTTTSKTAAGTRDDHYVPGQVDTRAVSGYVFDTNQGLPPADLPEVDAPEGVPVGESPQTQQEAAVPLEIEPSPTANPAAPPVLKSSPPVLQAEDKQARLFGQLDQLYTERKQLAQQGGAASSTEWTNVVNKISETQAQINYTEAMKRISGGSGVTDLTIRRKSRPLDAAVPSPDTKSP
jgi:hypothetical protein